jgi:hypothetical protein
MKYMLTFVRDQDDMYQATDEEKRAGLEAWTAFDKEAVEAGALIACEPLELPNTAKTLKFAEGGQTTITDGPFAETKEQLGGFALLECADLDEAMEWARKVPLLPGSLLEVRKVKDLSPWGYESSTVPPAKARATA